jgi:hypothetical protein
MSRRDPRVWSAHTSKACNQSERVVIRHNGTVVGHTVFRPDAAQPRAFVEFNGRIEKDAEGNAIIEIE